MSVPITSRVQSQFKCGWKVSLAQENYLDSLPSPPLQILQHTHKQTKH